MYDIWMLIFIIFNLLKINRNINKLRSLIINLYEFFLFELLIYDLF